MQATLPSEPASTAEAPRKSALSVYFSEVAAEWSRAYTGTPGFVRRGVAAAILMGPLSIYYPQFLRWVETRPGVILPDPLLEWLPAMDLSVPVFIVLYSCIGWTIISLMKKPDLLFRMLLAYCVLVAFRVCVMAVVPLDPPQNLVPLIDRLAETIGSIERPLTRDLFFSGHTSLISLLCFFAQSTRQRVFIGVCTLLMGLGVLIQHVHYTVDVLVAPVFSYAAYRLLTSGFFRISRSPN